MNMHNSLESRHDPQTQMEVERRKCVAVEGIGEKPSLIQSLIVSHSKSTNATALAHFLFPVSCEHHDTVT